MHEIRAEHRLFPIHFPYLHVWWSLCDWLIALLVKPQQTDYCYCFFNHELFYIIKPFLLLYFKKGKLSAPEGFHMKHAKEEPGGIQSMGFSRQEYWSGLPFPSPMHESEKWKWSRSVVSDSSRPHGLQPTRLLRPWDFAGKSTGVGCHCLLPATLQLPTTLLLGDLFSLMASVCS